MNITKREIAELVFTEEELKNIDFAIPQDWADKYRRETGMQPYFIVWDYNLPQNKYFGGPRNLAEEYVKKYEADLFIKVTEKMVEDDLKDYERGDYLNSMDFTRTLYRDCFVFNTDEEANTFMRQYPGYGVIGILKNKIYVTKNSDKGEQV